MKTPFRRVRSHRTSLGVRANRRPRRERLRLQRGSRVPIGWIQSTPFDVRVKVSHAPSMSQFTLHAIMSPASSTVRVEENFLD